MIVTRSWLNEWVDLDRISTDVLAKTFNAIGLEVDRIESNRVPKKIVVGRVIACERHPDADKLSVCKVDLGSSVRQIVCGAANVREGLLVAVATVGAVMPGGLKIKPVKLRGIESEGMICSSTEIGLPKLEEGIMELDESVGSLELGSALCENPFFNDDLIEIELTANRGDCLSIRGVARDLCAAFNRPMKTFDYSDEAEHRVGIGRVLQMVHEEANDANVRYRAVSLNALKTPLLQKLRLAQIEETKPTSIESLLLYATHSSGVILRCYPLDFFTKAYKQKAEVRIKYDEKGYVSVYGKEKASVVAVTQEKSSHVSDTDELILLEASYFPPDVISKKMNEDKIASDPFYYRTSRGSEPELALGMNYALGLLDAHSSSAIYGGSIDLLNPREEYVVSITLDEINALIGMKIDKTKITQILKNLGFNIGKSKGNSFVVIVPRFRHDIVNRQDVVEEIVRMVGIDNIDSKPFVFAEADRLEDDYMAYKKRRTYRHRAAQSGFYESIHFVFNERKVLETYNFSCVEPAYELLNPIVKTLDTLRPTLLMGLLESAGKNAKVGRKQIALFEVGTVFGTKREESLKMAMLFCGDIQRDALSNGGKPAAVTFEHFVQKVSDIIGDFTLWPMETSHTLAHPYQCAQIVIEGKPVGELFKLHPDVQTEFDLPESYLCEIDFDPLPYDLQQARPFSKFQASFRDLSVLIPSRMCYDEIEKVITQNKSSEVIRFYPVDRYEDENLGEQVSLTLRFVIQSPEKTLEEEDITSAMKGILSALETELGVALR